MLSAENTLRLQQIEVYVHDRTAAEFSHGICPECVQKYFPGFGGKT